MVRLKRIVFMVFAAVLQIAPAAAERLSQTTSETRTVLYFKVPDRILEARLPAGWKPVDFDRGPAEGANLTLNMSEQLTAVDADGKEADDARGRGITLSARVLDPSTGQPRAMVLFGLTNGKDTPGPYGTHLPATIGLDHSETDEGPSIMIKDSWRASDAKGNRVDIDLAFLRGMMVSSHLDQQTRSSLQPSFYRIYKMDLVSDIVRSERLKIDHLRHFKISLAGVPADILGPTPNPIAVTSVPIYRRAIWLPN